MKTIIACTDFSSNATNAVQYAAALADAAKARLILFHHFVYPVPATDLPEVYPQAFVDEMASGLEQQLRDIKVELENMYPIQVDCVVRYWSFPNDLEELFQSEAADLVVMSVQGQSVIMNALLGSAASGTIRRGNLPVLVVPQGVAFHPILKILFACDDHTIPNPNTVQALRGIARVFDAYIEVLTLFDLQKTPELVPDGNASFAQTNLEKHLAGTRHGYTFENENTVDKGIIYEAARSSADLVVMIPHHHSYLSSLFNQSETQRVALTITLPLLVLGEKVNQLAEM